MSRLATRAELDKLAVTLQTEPRALAFLADVPAEELRELRIAIHDLLFTVDRPLFRRLAIVARRLPPSLTAILCERVAGPAVTARMAAELPSARTVRVSSRLSVAFLADAAVDLDPRRARDVLRALPVERQVAVAQELVRRGDFMTMSRFVDFLSDAAIRRMVEAVEDDAALLWIAYYMGSKNRLDHLFLMLSERRLERLLVRVEEEADRLLAPFLSLLIHVGYGLKRTLGDLAAAQDEAVLTGYVRAVHEQGLWADLLPVVGVMSQRSRERVVNLPVLSEPEVQEGIVRATDEHELWGLTLELVELMDDANREAVATIVARSEPATLRRAIDAALLGELWEPLLDLVRRMPAARREQFAAIVVRDIGGVDPELLHRIARRAQAYDVALTG